MKVGALKTKIRKGDLVRVISGKERGKEGKVLAVLPIKHALLVESLNMLKKAMKPTQNQPQGGIVEREGKIHFSNVMLVCGACGKTTRAGRKELPDGKKLRFCKQCGDALDKGA